MSRVVRYVLVLFCEVLFGGLSHPMMCCLLTENGKNQPEAPKGPISFSIKSKDTKKPKIEYRTSVIYKQSYEQGQSDEDGDEADTETEGKETSDGNEGKLNAKKPEYANNQETSEKSADDLTQQMDSIKAAERIGIHMLDSFPDLNVSILQLFIKTGASLINSFCIFVRNNHCQYLACNCIYQILDTFRKVESMKKKKGLESDSTCSSKSTI